jgi:tetratricopeptide (TPR) repeat protein
MTKVGRNDPCPCGSGKKYKQCCLLNQNKSGVVNQQSQSDASFAPLQEAFEHLQSGRLAQAEQVYRKILQLEPNHPDALHYLGVIAYNVEKHEIAADLIGKAVRLAPTASNCSNLGLALQALGQLDAAAAQYQKALFYQPDHAVAHNNLANVYRDLGKLGEAVKHYHQAIALKPNFVEAHKNLGALLNRIKLLEATMEVFDISIDFARDCVEVCGKRVSEVSVNSPDFFDALIAIFIQEALKYHQLGQLSQAESLYQLVRKTKTNHPDALYLLGLVADALGRTALAQDLVARAVGAQPSVAEKYQNMRLGGKYAGEVTALGEKSTKPIFLRPDYSKMKGPSAQGLQLPSELEAENVGRASQETVIEIVSATRLSEPDFWEKSALGISLRSLSGSAKFEVHIAFANRRGLSEVYNERINALPEDRILVFIHDDVWIDDFFFADRLIHGLMVYDVIGVAGNRRRVPKQAGWGYIDDQLTGAEGGDLRGSIAHGRAAFGAISSFGIAPAACELLDGVILAARKSRLLAAQVQFDPSFNFHFYDIDFCRTAREKNLRVGTWPIYLTHQSEGAFGSPGWQQMYLRYLDKWKS